MPVQNTPTPTNVTFELNYDLLTTDPAYHALKLTGNNKIKISGSSFLPDNCDFSVLDSNGHRSFQNVPNGTGSVPASDTFVLYGTFAISGAIVSIPDSLGIFVPAPTLPTVTVVVTNDPNGAISTVGPSPATPTPIMP